MGIKELSALIHSAVEREIGSYSLKEKLSVHNIQAITDQIRHRIESSPEISDLTSPTIVLSKYMLPPEVSPKVTDTPAEQMYQKLLSETRDVIDSFHEIGIPLAKLVPVVNGLIFKLCSDAPNPLIQ
ncbi:hypothetical protein KUTeg_015840, partial [Tegillarca granosa]